MVQLSVVYQSKALPPNKVSMYITNLSCLGLLKAQTMGHCDGTFKISAGGNAMFCSTVRIDTLILVPRAKCAERLCKPSEHPETLQGSE